jgi:HAE1 family hydrophobic/amphiphilic exporter-1
VWSLAVLPDEAGANANTAAPSAVELTTWSEQVLKKRLENVRGVGAVNLVGATKREINIYLNPQALETFGVTPEQVVSASCATKNQDLPVGAIRSLAQERVVQIDARMERPEDFGKIIVARKNGAPVRLDQVARVNDGAQEVPRAWRSTTASARCCCQVQKSQGENTIEVVDGLNAAVAERCARTSCPPACGWRALATAPAPSAWR